MQHLGPQSLTRADPPLCDGALAGVRPTGGPSPRSVSLGAFSGLSGSSIPPPTGFPQSHPITRACVTVCPALCWVPRGLPLMVPHAGRALQPSRELPTTLRSQSPKTFQACAQPSANYSPRGPSPAAEGAQEHVLPADPRPQLPTRTWALAAKPQQHCPLPGA